MCSVNAVPAAWEKPPGDRDAEAVCRCAGPRVLLTGEVRNTFVPPGALS